MSWKEHSLWSGSELVGYEHPLVLLRDTVDS